MPGCIDVSTLFPVCQITSVTQTPYPIVISVDQGIIRPCCLLLSAEDRMLIMYCITVEAAWN